MKKKLQRFIASLNIFIFLSGIFLPLTPLSYAEEELIPYKYWGISIDAKLTVTPPGIMELIPGRNLQPASGTNFFDTSLFGVTLDGILTSDASIPKEYELTDNSILTYKEFFDQALNGTIAKLENKDINAWLSDTSLAQIGIGRESEASGLPFTINGQKDDKSFYVDIHIPDVNTMKKAPYTNRNGTTDGSDRRYDTTITFIIRAKHEKFDETTGEWDIDSNVKANLSMSEYSPAVWNYKSFDNNFDTEYAVVMDASRSTSARPRVTYTYDAGVDGDYFGEETSSTNHINYYADIYPDEIKGKVYQNGTFKVNGAVYVEDDRDVGEYAYANTNVGYRIENPSPTALSSITDKDTTSSQYLYANRPIHITDISTDPENELMDISYQLWDGSKEIAKWEFTKDDLNNPFRIKNESFDSTYITSMALDPEARTNEIVFAQKGTYTLQQNVGDVRNHDIVAQAFGNRNYTLNIRAAAAPPVADFEYRLHGKPTDFTYPNVPVALLDKSTDPNDDIVAWEWTRHDNSKAHTQEGVTATFPAEGIYETELKVTDFLGLSDSIKKPIEVLPPIPKAEITTNEAESLMKENRRIVLSAEESFEPPGDPIQWDKTFWSITPLDGQSADNMKTDLTQSNGKKKVMLFKETGRYKVNIELSNNFTASNPDHPRIDIRKAELIIEIVEDKDPVPQFTITGNSPNFKDNPKDTVAKVINTSVSDDGDYLDTYPTPKDDNDYFGRGKDAFLLEIRKDSNEDGVFADNEVYGKFSGREISIPVDFKENEGTDYRATLTAKETFGQPTLKNHVTDSDRRSKTIVHDFVINWIPDISFSLPEWAYPDDTLSLSTTIKDERVDTTTVVWSLEKQDTTGIYQPVDIKDNDIAINGLNKFGGNIQFLQSGFYKLIATVTDEKNQSSSYSREIRIYPLPQAILTDSFAWDNTDNPQSFNAKQNRKYKLSGSSSQINDAYGNGIHPINHDKDYWEIIPLDAQGLDSIKVAQGMLELDSEDGTIFKSTNRKLDHEMLYKLQGSFKVRYQVTNSIGKKSKILEQIITVHEDQVPLIDYRISEKVYRDPNEPDGEAKASEAKLLAYDIKISSPDRDNISLERVRYRFDSNNNGSFEDEEWKDAGEIDKTNNNDWNVSIIKDHVGKYQIEIYAEETYGQETIDRFVDKYGVDKRSNEVIKDTEIDNIAPLADLDAIAKENVDILFLTDEKYSNEKKIFKDDIKNNIIPAIVGEGKYDVNVKITEDVSYKDVNKVYNPNEILNWKYGKDIEKPLLNRGIVALTGSYTLTNSDVTLKANADGSLSVNNKYSIQNSSSSYIARMGVASDPSISKLPKEKFFKYSFEFNFDPIPSNGVDPLLTKDAFTSFDFMLSSIKKEEFDDARNKPYNKRDDIKLTFTRQGLQDNVSLNWSYGGYYQPVIYLDTGKWIKVEYIFDETGLSIYVNGVKVFTYQELTDLSSIIDPIIITTSRMHYSNLKWDHIKFRNFAYSTLKSNSIDELLLKANWREDSNKVILNFDSLSSTLSNLDDVNSLLAIQEMVKNDISYVHLGDGYYFNKVSRLIEQLNKGAFIPIEGFEESSDYTKDSTFTARESGKYQIETWGKEGVSAVNGKEKYFNLIGADAKVKDYINSNMDLYKSQGKAARGGLGSYASGTLTLGEGDILYPSFTNSSDVRTSKTDLASRIVVAGEGSTPSIRFMYYACEKYPALVNYWPDSRYIMFEGGSGGDTSKSTPYATQIPNYYAGRQDAGGPGYKAVNHSSLSPIYAVKDGTDGSFGKGGRSADYKITSDLIGGSITNIQGKAGDGWYGGGGADISRQNASHNLGSPMYPNIAYTSYFYTIGTGGGGSSYVSPELQNKKIVFSDRNFYMPNRQINRGSDSIDGYVRISKVLDKTERQISDEIKDYIYSLFDEIEMGSGNYLVIGEEIRNTIHYSDYENDLQYDIHQWKYEHNPNHFENPLGEITEAEDGYSNSSFNIFENNFKTGTNKGGINKFSKTGRYLIGYRTKDNPVGTDDRFDNYRKWSTMPNGPMEVFVHRKPLADFTFKINKYGANMTVTADSKAYDLDHESEPKKGIVTKEWYYKDINAGTWTLLSGTESVSFSGETTKDYFLKHRVRDIDGPDGLGEWSEEIKLITTKPLPPTAKFDITPKIYQVKSGQTMNIQDKSSDPNDDPLVEYRWNLTKTEISRYTKTLTNPSGVTQSQIDTVASDIQNTIEGMGHAAYGIWTLELQIRDNTGAWGDTKSTSYIYRQEFEVIPNNQPPSANISPTNVFIDGRNITDIDNLTSPLNEYIDWKAKVTDPDVDNKGFIYRWELENHEGLNGTLKSTKEMSGKDKLSTKIYTSALPFTNKSFEENNFKPGPYKVRLQVTDMPVYGEAKTVNVEKTMYVVPKITATPYVISEKDEIIVGDTLLLRVVTDKITTKITAEMLGTEVELQYKRSEGINDIWEAEIIVPEIDNDAEVDVNFLVETDYGSYDVFGQDGQTTRIKTMKETVNVIALKLEDFRVVDMVKHAEYKNKYPLRQPDFLLNYIAGYYVTFRIDSKGNPDEVFADVSIDGDTPQKIELKKVDANVWEGKYFALYDTPKDSIISFNLEATKSSSFFNYNDKNNWDGETLIVVDTLLKDAKIQRTN